MTTSDSLSGTAFPWNEKNGDGTHFHSHGGMALRDYFAAQALAGICGDGIPGSHHRPDETAKSAYEYADAMLKAREVKNV